MSIVLPKRSIKETIVPIDATGTGGNPGVSGTWGSYSTVTTTGMNEFVLWGIYYHGVFTEALASFSGSIPVQFEIALGTAGNEVPIAKGGYHYGIQYTHGSSNAQIGAAGLCRIAPVLIPNGSTVRLRSVTPSAHTCFQRIYLAGYKTTDGFPLVRPRDIDFFEQWMRGMKTGVVNATDTSPDGAFTNIANHASTVWAYGTTVEMIASASSDILITAVITSVQDSISVNALANLEIGIGTSGNEEWLSMIGQPTAASMPGPGGGYMPLIRPLWVKQGERVACRSKGTANRNYDIALVYDAIKG